MSAFLRNKDPKADMRIPNRLARVLRRVARIATEFNAEGGSI